MVFLASSSTILLDSGFYNFAALAVLLTTSSDLCNSLLAMFFS